MRRRVIDLTAVLCGEAALLEEISWILVEILRCEIGLISSGFLAKPFVF